MMHGQPNINNTCSCVWRYFLSLKHNSIFMDICASL